MSRASSDDIRMEAAVMDACVESLRDPTHDSLYHGVAHQWDRLRRVITCWVVPDVDEKE